MPANTNLRASTQLHSAARVGAPPQPKATTWINANSVNRVACALALSERISGFESRPERKVSMPLRACLAHLAHLAYLAHLAHLAHLAPGGGPRGGIGQDPARRHRCTAINGAPAGRQGEQPFAKIFPRPSSSTFLKIIARAHIARLQVPRAFLSWPSEKRRRGCCRKGSRWR